MIIYYGVFLQVLVNIPQTMGARCNYETMNLSFLQQNTTEKYKN